MADNKQLKLSSQQNKDISKECEFCTAPAGFHSLSCPKHADIPDLDDFCYQGDGKDTE